jgi:hypothetical protein
MIELHFDLKFKTTPWKKALAFSFLFYLILLIVCIFVIISIKKDIDNKLLGIVFGACVSALILSFRYMYRIFKEKLLLL